MKEEIEYISPRSINSISFVCSFGFKVLGVTKRSNRMNDIYYLYNWDTGAEKTLQRKDFFSYISDTFGGVRKRNKPPNLNPCRKEFKMF